MDRKEKSNDIERLRLAVERVIGRTVTTRADFLLLRDAVFSRTRRLVSESTLMRLWGYMPEVTSRSSTLDILANFVGSPSWEAFRADDSIMASDYLLCNHLDVARELTPGQTLLLQRQPERMCRLRYRGDCMFEVESSENTRLVAGNTFRCAIVIEGEPLYLDDLIQGVNAPVGYVCGKVSGVTYMVDPPEKNS